MEPESIEEEGGDVILFKINGGGCSKIHGKDEGTIMPVFFDPNTGKELDRIDV